MDDERRTENDLDRVCAQRCEAKAGSRAGRAQWLGYATRIWRDAVSRQTMENIVGKPGEEIPFKTQQGKEMGTREGEHGIT